MLRDDFDVRTDLCGPHHVRGPGDLRAGSVVLRPRSDLLRTGRTVVLCSGPLLLCSGRSFRSRRSPCNPGG